MLVYTTNHAVRSSVFLRGDKKFASIFGCWTNVLVQVYSMFADLCWFCYRLYDVIRILIVDVANIFARVSSKESKRHDLQKNIKVVSRKKKSQIYLIILTVFFYRSCNYYRKMWKDALRSINIINWFNTT